MEVFTIKKNNKNLFNFAKKAFTLAEVLITIGIIGVVAIYTIPVLMRAAQTEQYVVGLKKFYGDFNQILTKVAYDKSCDNNLKCTGLFTTSTTNQTLGDAFSTYFDIYKNCQTASGQGCWAAATNDSYDGSSGTNYQWDNSSDYKFQTLEGMSILIHNYAVDAYSDCGNNLSTNILNTMSQTCGYIIVDVNGPKKPNALGRDTFKFYITDTNGALIYPSGGMDDKSTGANNWWNLAGANNCSASGGSKSGQYCPGRIIEKSWAMDY